MITMPAIALRGMTLLPGMVAHFDISRDKSIKAVEAAMNDNQKIYVRRSDGYAFVRWSWRQFAYIYRYY